MQHGYRPGLAFKKNKYPFCEDTDPVGSRSIANESAEARNVR
jgi:hypothetical protein